MGVCFKLWSRMQGGGVHVNMSANLLLKSLVFWLSISVPGAFNDVSLYWTWTELSNSEPNPPLLTRLLGTRNEGAPEILVEYSKSGTHIETWFYWASAEATIFGKFATDPRSRLIFIHDRLDGSIMAMNTSTARLDTIYRGSSRQVTDITIDWVNENVYYSDPATGIGVLSYKHVWSGPVRSTILVDDVNVESLAADPTNGYLFWLESLSSGSTRIVRADLAGRDQRELRLVGTGCHSLKAVPARRLLYWLAEGRTGVLSLWRADYDGDAAEAIIGDLTAFADVEVYEDYVFLLAGSWAAIWIYNVTGEFLTTIDTKLNQQPVVQFGINILAPEMRLARQSGPELDCSTNNGECDHICVQSSDLELPYCLCDVGYDLAADNKTCLSSTMGNSMGKFDGKFLVIMDSEPAKLYRMDIESGNLSAFYTGEDPIYNMVYDRVNRDAFWTEAGAIWRMNLSTQAEPILVYNHSQNENSTIIDLALAKGGQFILYSDTGLRYIASLNTTESDPEPKVLVANVSAKLLNLHEGNGLLAWVSVDGPAHTVYLAGVDLSGSDPVVKNSHRGASLNETAIASAMAFDTNGEWLYLSEWDTGGISRVSTTLNDTEPIPMTTLDLPPTSHIQAIVPTDDKLYVGTTHVIYSMNNSGGGLAKLGPEVFWTVYDVMPGFDPNLELDVQATPGPEGGKSIDASTITLSVTLTGTLLFIIVFLTTFCLVINRRCNCRKEPTEPSVIPSESIGHNSDYETISQLSEPPYTVIPSTPSYSETIPPTYTSWQPDDEDEIVYKNYKSLRYMSKTILGYQNVHSLFYNNSAVIPGGGAHEPSAANLRRHITMDDMLYGNLRQDSEEITRTTLERRWSWYEMSEYMTTAVSSGGYSGETSF